MAPEHPNSQLYIYPIKCLIIQGRSSFLSFSLSVLRAGPLGFACKHPLFLTIIHNDNVGSKCHRPGLVLTSPLRQSFAIPRLRVFERDILTGNFACV